MECSCGCSKDLRERAAVIMLAFGQRSFRQVSRYVAAPHRALWKRTLVSARESVISKQVRGTCLRRVVVALVTAPCVCSVAMDAFAGVGRHKVLCVHVYAQEELDKLPELRQRALFQDQLQRGDSSHPIFGLPQNGLTPQGVGLDRDTFLRMLEVSMATFLLHVEARVFAYIGQVRPRVCCCWRCSFFCVAASQSPHVWRMLCTTLGASKA